MAIPLGATLTVGENISEQNVSSRAEVILQILPAHVAVKTLDNQTKLATRHSSGTVTPIRGITTATATTAASTSTASKLYLNASTLAGRGENKLSEQGETIYE